MELAELALMKAVFSDPDKKAVLDEIEAAVKRNEEAKAAAEAATLAHQHVVIATQATLVRAQAAQADVAAREKVLQDSTEGLANANRAMNEEKTRWEKIRQTVDADQKKWTDELADRESKVEARERIVEKREKDVIAEGEALADAQRKHEAAADHAARFLTAINARPA